MSDTHCTRPIAPAPRLDTIPAELIARVQWVCWWYEWNGKKWTKPLIIPGTKCNASHSNKKHWRSFTEAYAAYMQSPTNAGGIYDGIGYVFSKDDPYVGGDIDHDVDRPTDRDPKLVDQPWGYLKCYADHGQEEGAGKGNRV